MNGRRLLEQKYTEMKLTYKNLVNANIDLVDENKDLKEEIERLNKCYCERTDCSGRIKNSKKYESMQEEIERLKEEYIITCKQKNKYISTLEESLNIAEERYLRLNNIINEFDKLIKNEINESKLEDNYERVDSLEYCLATLKELKGSDK